MQAQYARDADLRVDFTSRSLLLLFTYYFHSLGYTQLYNYDFYLTGPVRACKTADLITSLGKAMVNIRHKLTSKYILERESAN